MNYRSMVGYEISKAVAETIMDWHTEDGHWYSTTGTTGLLVARAIMDLPEHNYWRPDRDYKQGLLILQRLKEDFGASYEFEHTKGNIECVIFTDEIRVNAKERWDFNIGNEVLCDASLAFWQTAHKDGG